MDYKELFSKALQGRSVNKAAKDWDVPQKTLDRYVKGTTLPDYQTALKIAKDAGIDVATVVRIFAEAEAQKKPRGSLMEIGYAAATILVSVNLFLTPSPTEAKQINDLQPTMSRGTCVMSNRIWKLLRALKTFLTSTPRPTAR